MIFVLQDASGRQWRSLSESSPIDFDGWRYLAVKLPPQYAGPENHNWPRDKDGVAHYPLTFKKLVVEMPEKVLHVKTFSPVPRPEIYLKDLTAAQGDTSHAQDNRRRAGLTICSSRLWQTYGTTLMPAKT